MAGPEIVGRDDDLGAIDPFLDGLTTGPAALLFDGGPGIGKTTVWRRAVERAVERGYTVLACRPAAAEAKLAFASLADLVEPVADAVLPSLPAPQRQALEVALVRASPSGTPPSPRAAAAAMLSVVRSLSKVTPVVLAVDDQQWLDGASAATLAFALRRIVDRRVGVIATARLDEGPGDPLGLDATFATRFERRRLGPLSTSALHHVLRAHLGHVFPRPTLRRIAETSGGNPFFAIELSRALIDAGSYPGPGEPLPVPDTLASLMARRIDRLPTPSRQVLLIAAITAAPTIALLQAAAGADAASDALARAQRADILMVDGGRVRFTHPLLAAAVGASASAGARRAAHARLATVVAESEERARHLAFAAEQADETVARALEDAAIHARRRGASDTAADLHERAAALTPGDDAAAQRRRRTRAAEDLFQAGDFARARALLDVLLADAPAGLERARVLRVLGRLNGQEDSFSDAVVQLEEALAICDEPALGVAIQMDLAYAIYGTGDVPRSVEVASEALAAAERRGDDGVVASALALLAIGEYILGRRHGRERTARALALEDPSCGDQVFLRPSAIAGLLAMYDGRLADADALLRDVCARARERGEESGLALLLFHLSWLACWRGDLAEGIRWADEAYLLTAQNGSEVWRGLSAMHRSRPRAGAGDVDGARADIAEARTLFEQASYAPGLAWLLPVEASLELSLGDAQATTRVLEPLIAMTEAMGGYDPFAAAFMTNAVEALAAVGEPSRAAAVLQRYENCARTFDCEWAVAAALRARSVLVAAGGDLDGALATAEEAVRRFDPLGMPTELGRAYLVLGQIHRRRGERRAARAALESARDLLVRYGARQWADRAADALRRVPVRRSANGDLTPTEAQVAALAAAGKTNREVAKALFMSPKTVEANLSRIYGKLGIRSRAELGARMAAKK